MCNKVKEFLRSNGGDALRYGILCVFVLVCTVVLVIANITEKASVARCTEEVAAGLIDESNTSVLYAPRYGGPVYDMYTYRGTYTWEVNGEEYKIGVTHRTSSALSGFPYIITIRYNPENPDEYYVDTSELMGSMRVYTDRKTGKLLPYEYQVDE